MVVLNSTQHPQHFRGKIAQVLKDYYIWQYWKYSLLHLIIYFTVRSIALMLWNMLIKQKIDFTWFSFRKKESNIYEAYNYYMYRFLQNIFLYDPVTSWLHAKRKCLRKCPTFKNIIKKQKCVNKLTYL